MSRSTTILEPEHSPAACPPESNALTSHGFDPTGCTFAAHEKSYREDFPGDMHSEPEIPNLHGTKIGVVSIPEQQVAVESGDITVREGEPKGTAAGSTRSQQAPERCIAPVTEIVWERAEMWAWAAKHMRPEPIPLTDMGLQEDEQVDDQDNGQQENLAANTPWESAGTHWLHAPPAQLLVLDGFVRTLARALRIALYGLGVVLRYVKVQPGRVNYGS